MLHSTPPAPARSRRPSLKISSASPGAATSLINIYSDAREHGYQGPTRTVRLPKAASSGGGAIAKSEDGDRCVVAGKSCMSSCENCRTLCQCSQFTALRILRLSDVSTSISPDHHTKIGRGGHRIDAGRNLWTLAGFKVESATTDVAWGRQSKLRPPADPANAVLR
jgi:hypothetical protein